MNRSVQHLMFPIFIGIIASQPLKSQPKDTITLDLNSVIRLANDSSLSAFRAKNMYLTRYWEYRTFKANRLPSISLNMTPIRYNRDFTRRYDSEQNIDVYRQQQSLYSSGNLNIKQNFDQLGGTFYVDSELGYIRNVGDRTFSQFNSIPIRMGYQQNLLGYNSFRWEKQIEPLKFEKAKKELIFQMEQTSEEAATLFFDLALVQAEYNLALENRNNADTLYGIGVERKKIASIGQTDLTTLRLDRVNAKNSLQNAEIRLKRSMSALNSFLNIDKSLKIRLLLPTIPKSVAIPVEKALKLAHSNSPTLLNSKIQMITLQRDAEKAKREQMVNASVGVSVGFNQVAESFRKSYQNPLQQDIISFTLSIPIVDWGVKKGKYNTAVSNLKTEQLQTRQNEIKLEEEVTITIGDILIQRELIGSAEEAVELAQMAYDQTRERFIIGKADINTLLINTTRHQEAQRNYIGALRSYWQSYFRIRKITLYDFEEDKPIEVDNMLNL